MRSRDFTKAIEALIERQGGESFVALALGELGITYIDEVTHHAFFLQRCVALWEESL